MSHIQDTIEEAKHNKKLRKINQYDSTSWEKKAVENAYLFST
jgi:hypothetical protein